MVTAMDHEAAIAAARAQARDTYRRELGAVIYVGREGDSTEVVATLRTDGKLAFRPSGYNTPGDGLDPNGITALVAAMAESRGMVQS
jgi:hypothetical protein